MLGDMIVHMCPLYHYKGESTQNGETLYSVHRKQIAYLEYEKIPRVIIFLRSLSSLTAFYSCTLWDWVL